MANLRYLHIIVPQGTKEDKKLESRFQDLLTSLRNTVTEERFSFEYFGYEQYTYFYAVMEEKYKETIEGLIYATFPDAEIRETNDYTAWFDPAQHYFAGCELRLKERDVYPVKTYGMFEEDSMSRLFSVISKIESGEQVWVQIVVEPHADSALYHFLRGWRFRFAALKKFFSIRDRMRKEGRHGIQSVRSEAAKEKEKTKPFKVSIRCAYISRSFEEASRKLEAVKNSFYHFNDSDINGFLGTRSVNTASYLRQYRERTHASTYILSAKEAATLYHFPNADYVHHIVHVLARKSDPPQDLPRADEGEGDVSVFGVTNYHNNFVRFGIRLEDRRRHLYVVGKSGSGKSKLLELLVHEDLLRGRGVAVLDPHGDLVDSILRFVPKHRINDVVVFDPSDIENPIAFNPLEKVEDAYKMQLTIGFLDIFKKLFGDNWTYRLEHVLRYTTLALLDSPNTTVLSILKMLNDKNYRQKIVARIQDNVVKSFWVSEFAAW